MSVTEKLLEIDPSLRLHPEGHWDQNTIIYPSFTSFNDAGVEAEVGELLYGFVRVLQPDRILETGTHWGVGSCYMAMGLKDNGKGELDTFEFLPEIYEVAKKRFEWTELDSYINNYLMDVAKWKPKKGIYGMALLDTEPQTRFGELLKFIDSVKDGGFIFIHDLHRHMGQVENEEHGFAWPWGNIPEGMINLINWDVIRPFHFDTPRGLTGFYKVHPGDYKL